MGSSKNGEDWPTAAEGRKIGTPPPLDVYDSFPKGTNRKVTKMEKVKRCERFAEVIKIE